MRALLRLSLAVMALAALAPAVLSQRAFPTHPIRLIVPYPAGGATDVVARIVAEKMSEELGQPVALSTVRLGAPVPVPRSLIIAGANTKTHIAEAGAVLGEMVGPREPMLLAKATSSLCGAHDDVILPLETNKLDYEVELGVIIGCKARRISEKDVKDYVVGFHRDERRFGTRHPTCRTRKEPILPCPLHRQEFRHILSRRPCAGDGGRIHVGQGTKDKHQGEWGDPAEQ